MNVKIAIGALSLLINIQCVFASDSEKVEDCPASQGHVIIKNLLQSHQGELKKPCIKRTFNKNYRSAISAVYSPDGLQVAVGGTSEVFLYNVESGELLHTFKDQDRLVYSLAYNTNGSLLASGSMGNMVAIWDTKKRTLVDKLTGHDRFVLSVDYSSDDLWLASGSYDKTIILWDAASGKLVHRLVGHDERVLSLAFRPDNKQLASGSADNTVILWDVATGKLVNRLTGHNDLIFSLAYIPNSSWLVSGSYDKTAILWNVVSGKRFQTLTGHSKALSSIACHPNGSQIASGSYDETVILWDVATGNPLYKLEHERSISSLDFSPAGSELLVGTNLMGEASQHNIAIWSIPNPAKIAKVAHICSRLAQQHDSASIGKDADEVAERETHVQQLHALLPSEPKECNF